MATAARHIPLQTYLRTIYRPDRDYVDGKIEKRNLGERDHSLVVGNLCVVFGNHRKQTGINAFVSLRLQLGPTLIRVTDMALFLGKPEEQIPRKPPLACIEVLSRLDRITPMNARVRDYLEFAVPVVWLIDPDARRLWIYRRNSPIVEATESVTLYGTSIEIPFSDIFDL